MVSKKITFFLFFFTFNNVDIIIVKQEEFTCGFQSDSYRDVCILEMHKIVFWVWKD